MNRMMINNIVIIIQMDKKKFYEVEQIIGKRFNVKTKIYEYKIKWKNYSTEESTWEPMSSLMLIQDLINRYEEQNKSTETEIKEEQMKKPQRMKRQSRRVSAKKEKSEQKQQQKSIEIEEQSDLQKETPSTTLSEVNAAILNNVILKNFTNILDQILEDNLNQKSLYEFKNDLIQIKKQYYHYKLEGDLINKIEDSIDKKIKLEEDKHYEFLDSSEVEIPLASNKDQILDADIIPPEKMILSLQKKQRLPYS